MCTMRNGAGERAVRPECQRTRGWLLVADQQPSDAGDPLAKSDREIMDILDAFDLTRCAHSAARLAGCDEKTVARYVAIRHAGRDPLVRVRRPRSIDPFLPKIEEWVDRSHGKVRADVVHQRPGGDGVRGHRRQR
jgi:hypothetical protein